MTSHPFSIFPYFLGLGILLLSNFACKTTNHLVQLKEDRLTIKQQENLPGDKAIAQLIQPYKDKLDKEMSEIIGQTATDLEKKRPEGTLGNWMADAIHREAEKTLGESIDFAIQNYGGIRIPEIKKGNITRGKIYELMPFDNEILVLYLTKSEVEQLVAHILKARGWPVSHSIKIEQKSGLTNSILINNQPLISNRIYKVALPDYIANGGSRSDFLIDKKRKKLNKLIRDALIEDVIAFRKNNQAIESAIEGRIVLARK